MTKITLGSFLKESAIVLKNYFFKLRYFFLVFGVLGIYFATEPSVDYYISNMFYKNGEGFYLANKPLFMAVYHGVNYITVAMIAAFVIFIFYSFIKKQDVVAGVRRKAIIFLLIALIFAPGVVVNGFLKEGVGRPRPQDVTLFNGDKQFQPPFIVSNECADNCSFVSGHAALGFYFMSFAFVAGAVFRRRYLLASGFAIGCLVGLVRIIQGRHFFTDVLFCFFFVYAAIALVYEFMYHSNYKAQSK